MAKQWNKLRSTKHFAFTLSVRGAPHGGNPKIKLPPERPAKSPGMAGHDSPGLCADIAGRPIVRILLGNVVNLRQERKKHAEQEGIELALPPTFLHDLHRLVFRQGVVVHAAMGQGIIDVDDRQDAGRLGDRQPGQSPRIAAAVPVFVVGHGDFVGHLQNSRPRPFEHPRR